MRLTKFGLKNNSSLFTIVIVLIFVVSIGFGTIGSSANSSGDKNKIDQKILSLQSNQSQTCTYSINPASQNFSANSATGSFIVTTAPTSGCAWTAVSDEFWVMVTAGSSGNGNGTVNYTVGMNTDSAPRTATISVGGRIFTVNQAGAVAARTAYDFDGDERADVSVFRPATSGWYWLNSGLNDSFSAVQFGASSDKLAPADFDGDGRTDVSVFRNGNWYRLNSSTNQFVAVQFGQAGDVPVPADFDGDARADVAVFRAGNWYILNSSNNQFQAISFGASSDEPVPADFDGDNKTDIAVFRDGNWFCLQSTNNEFRAMKFGMKSDKTVVGDYDGDARADQAVFRNGVWYLNRSTAGLAVIEFGVATDTPTPADYDGDRQTDISVFRNGNWFRINSLSGNVQTVQFGMANDFPVPTK